MIRIGSLFSGYRGLDMGVQSALGGRVAWHCEIEPAAMRLLATHAPKVPNLGDITTVNWHEVEPVDIITGGFPCFPAGTLIDAGEDGLRPIETLRVGDRVLTHARRRRRVTSVMRRDADDALTVKAMGAPEFRVTAEHPFYVRRRQPGRVRTWSTSQWVDAGELVAGDMLAMPLDDAGDVEIVGPERAYVIGRWLGDGWIVDHRRTSLIEPGHRGSRITSRVHKAIICAAAGEADELAARIAAAGLHATRSDERTVVKFHISSAELVRMLRDFGRGAAGKRLPGWAFTATDTERAALLQGWLDADGSRQASGAWRGTTVSEELAYGMARLGRNVYRTATSVHRFDVPGATVIEGRTVRQRPQFQVVIPPRNREAFVEDGYAWVPVRSVAEADPVEVFNVSVEDDESYTAWGFAVHNCQDVSSAGRRAGMKPGTRSGLWAHMARAIHVLRPRLVVIENVRGLLSADAACDVEPCPWCLGDQHDRPLRALGAVLGDLAVLGYDARWCGLRAADAGAPHARYRVFIAAWPAADPGGAEPERRGVGGVVDGAAGPGEGEGPQRERDRNTVGDGGAAVEDPDCAARDQRWVAASGEAEGGRSRPDVGGPGRARVDADSDGAGREGPVGQVAVSVGQREAPQHPGDAASQHRVVAWGDYGPAIRRWELILGRAAPVSTMTGKRGGQQLSPAFVEWLMGLPAGHVTAVPGLSRNEQLKLLGNGVVPQQAELALRHLLATDYTIGAAA